MQKNKCQCEYIWHLYLHLYWYIPVGVSIIEENTCGRWSYIGNSALRPGWHNTYILEQCCGFDIGFNFLPIIKFVVWGCKYEDMVKRRTSVKKNKNYYTCDFNIRIVPFLHNTNAQWPNVNVKKNKKQNRKFDPAPKTFYNLVDSLLSQWGSQQCIAISQLQQRFFAIFTLKLIFKSTS